MIEAVMMMGGLGVLVGAGLAAASKVFYVYVDPTILKIEDVLPGANCGGCGLPGCSANAEAIVAGKAAADSCVAAGSDVAEAIAAIMGIAIEAREPDIARPGCYFGVQDADLKFIYNGLSDCKAAMLLGGGMKICSIGCLGLGSCARACPFDAIVMGPKGLPVVNEERCTGCGACERVCPKHIITLSSVTRRILREYTTEECTTPCQRGCPAGINIREYIRQIAFGDYNRSVQVIKERNPFPTVIGRICPRPCENECRRKYVDEPVAINCLKRFASDYEKGGGRGRILPYKAPPTGRKVAVVGAGVGGLSAAFFSARLGHEVSVFEATSEMGGLLRSAIAKYRLPGEILEWDIEGILAMGVEARTEKMMGRDFTVDSLLGEQGFNAVLLTTGGWDSRLTRGADSIEQSVPGTYMLLDLIKSDAKRHNKIYCESEVVIAGGERTALEAADICHDLGVENITVLFRETQEQLSLTDGEIEEPRKKGICIVFEAGICRIFGEDDNLNGVEYLNFGTMSRTIVSAKNLFIASGRFPELIFTRIQEEEGEEAPATPGPVRWDATLPYKDLRGFGKPVSPGIASPETSAREDLRGFGKPMSPGITSSETSEVFMGLLSKGDVLTDYSAAIGAIAAGRRIAASVHQIMYGISPDLPETVLRPDSVIQDVDHVEQVQARPRQIMPVCNAKELAECGEIEKGLDEKAAQAEASRCLQCGLICYEHSESGAVRIEESVKAAA